MPIFFTRGVNSVAVVDEQGKFFGNLSATDLKGVYGRSFMTLLDTVQEYLKDVRIKRAEGISLKHPHYTASMTADETIAQGAKRMVDLHVHRLFIVDEASKPIGVLSITDVISTLAHE